MAKRYLGIDCANRSFAWCICTHHPAARANTRVVVNEFLDFIGKITDNFADSLLDALSADNFSEFMDYISRVEEASRPHIQMEASGVHDILGGPTSDFNDAARAKKLRNFLDSHEIINENIAVDEIIIEHQPPRCGKFGAASNAKSIAVSSQLLFYYANSNVSLVSPKLKNKYYAGSGLALCDFGDTYTGRKKHTKANLLFLAGAYRFTHAITAPKPMLDDLADAFIQVVAART